MGANAQIEGNVVAQPELRFTPSGTPVAEFSVAVNRSYTPKDGGSKVEQVSFFDVVAWQSLGENAAESLDKGDRVIVMGRLEQVSWETEDGQKRSKIRIVADNVAPGLRWAKAQVTKNPRPDMGPSAADAEDGQPF
jgi:single-strand DNA-binding protein